MTTSIQKGVNEVKRLDLWYAPGKFLSPPGERDFVKLPVGEWLSGQP
ncbi:MAG: hypothetical protein NTV86_00670 [Planctomycetota bacterium]|nr:hypothetical protein [Planctomycetota bacterium]